MNDKERIIKALEKCSNCENYHKSARPKECVDCISPAGTFQNHFKLQSKIEEALSELIEAKKKLESPEVQSALKIAEAVGAAFKSGAELKGLKSSNGEKILILGENGLLNWYREQKGGGANE